MRVYDLEVGDYTNNETTNVRQFSADGDERSNQRQTDTREAACRQMDHHATILFWSVTSRWRRNGASQVRKRASCLVYSPPLSGWRHLRTLRDRLLHRGTAAAQTSSGQMRKRAQHPGRRRRLNREASWRGLGSSARCNVRDCLHAPWLASTRRLPPTSGQASPATCGATAKGLRALIGPAGIKRTRQAPLRRYRCVNRHHLVIRACVR